MVLVFVMGPQRSVTCGPRTPEGSAGLEDRAAAARSARVHHHLRRVLIENVTEAIRAATPIGVRVPPDLLADYVVSTFILVLNWWVDSRNTLSPREVDDIFLAPRLTVIVRSSCS